LESRSWNFPDVSDGCPCFALRRGVPSSSSFPRPSAISRPPYSEFKASRWSPLVQSVHPFSPFGCTLRGRPPTFAAIFQRLHERGSVLKGVVFSASALSSIDSHSGEPVLAFFLFPPFSPSPYSVMSWRFSFLDCGFHRDCFCDERRWIPFEHFEVFL